ncbi:hypothetical protein [Reyranella sp.]|uniref:hypothetical protein n=1 Tax=Reyranella sp. TaxID=1929291 RepID=UPI00272FAA19|nr:hypothetical protein [Reyranella sp.]MDP2373162.1 hypothetical protein [Reyranella sp.]
MALAAPRRNIARLAEGRASYRVAAAAVCIQTGLAMLAAGYVRPAAAGAGATTPLKAAAAATCQVVGVFVDGATGGDADGDVRVEVQAGVWNFGNSAGADALTVADIGRPCFVVDDETVARRSADQTRPIAGVVENVDADGVWVKVGPLGLGKRIVAVPFFINQTDLLAGTSAELVAPVAGEIVGLNTIVQIAVTTGGPITVSVGTTPVAGLTVTVPDAATKGSILADAPTAGDASAVVTAGSRIQVTPDAAFSTAGAVSGSVLIAY